MLALPPIFASALPTPDDDIGGITLPDGFAAVVVADLGDLKDSGGPRFIAVAPNGDIYAKLRKQGIVALRDEDGDGRADVIKNFGRGGGTGVRIRGNWLYYSTTTEVGRYKLDGENLVPQGRPEIIVKGLPDKRQHNAKGFAFDDSNGLLVEVGSPSNALGVPDRSRGAGPSSNAEISKFLSQHGGLWLFDADKAGQRQADGEHFSTGHRHMIGFDWNPVSGQYFGTMHGRDVLNVVAPDHYSVDDNAERVAEEFHVLKRGGNLGWPYTYYDPLHRKRMMAPEYGGDGEKTAPEGRYPDPLIAFPAHWAPLQMSFYNGEQFPAKYRGGAFIAFRGSWNRAPNPQRGYNITFVPFGEDGMPVGSFEVFADKFGGDEDFSNPRDANYRPTGVTVGPDGSLYVCAEQGGRIWRIFHTGG